MDELEFPESYAQRNPKHPNRRLTKVCSRCRKRKIKCDFKIPACSPCEKAAAFPCMGYDGRQGKEIPRSITTFLEARVAELESEIEELRVSTSLNGSENDIATSSTCDTSSVVCISSGLAAALSDVVVSTTQNSYARIIYAAFQHPCSLPLPFARQKNKKHESHPPSYSKAVRFSDVPRPAADFMLRNYTEIHLPQYPCVYEPDLLESYKKCFDMPSEATPFDIFTVSMALAISANTLIWKNKTDAYAASSVFWATAREQFEEIGHQDNSLRSLQAALLLSHYASTNPKAVDIFYCIGEAARICIHLGLHREPPEAMAMNPLELDIRRRLFWTTYGIERSVCSVLRLPFSLNEEVVTTQFPSSLADSCITSSGFLTGPHKKASALHFYAFRKLETEVHKVLYLERGLIGETLDEWLTDVTMRIDQWHSKALEFAPEHKLEFRNVQLNFLKGRLHRPTPRNLQPSQASRIESVQASMRLAEEYQKQQRNERLFYPWLAVHVLFEAAIVLLDACWNSVELLIEHIRISDLIKCINKYPDILKRITPVWSDVEICVETIQSLSEPVLCRLERLSSNLEVSEPDLTISKRINAFLFPDHDEGQAPLMLSPEEQFLDEFDNAGVPGNESDWLRAWQLEDTPLENTFQIEETTLGLFTGDALDPDAMYLATLFQQLD
ncbi:fungal-specific transcription factor domain-containing protein [Xylogone sp. PMI_703]|nr:fungal-specific transcription factor domain-containing protein [Xylogone sp. PMI_703]